MKVRILGIIIALLAITVTAAFAKTDTLHKNYEGKATSVTVHRAKGIYEDKAIMLQHPQKMSALQTKYAAVRKACAHHAHGGYAVKGAFVQKASRMGYYHNCPYMKDAPRTACHKMPSAKGIHQMKCDMSQHQCKMHTGSSCCK
ncbi:MAG TPA: hypothetical protein VHV83_08875 [Armatimonadota bacterium]|nr:hypothetical protein [Armatimonadota bacterium]